MLLTPRLLLRPYQPGDAADFFRVLHENRARLTASFPDRLRSVPTLAEAPAQLASFSQDWHAGRFYVFGIWQREAEAYLGDICLMPQHGGQAEIGYYLAREAEGQGYAREALSAVMRFGFGQVGARRLLIRCFADNPRGQAVARAQGFVPEPPPAESAFWPWQRLTRWRATAAPEPEILYFVCSAPPAQPEPATAGGAPG